MVLCERGAVVGVDQRGRAPGTRETDLARPLHLVQEAHAVVLSGGSAFGLDAASGVVHYLEEKVVGFDAGVARVPIVAAAILYDLYKAGRSDSPEYAEVKEWLVATRASQAAINLLLDELEFLLDLGYDDVVGYWHDVSHAQTLEHLGFCSQEEWLRRFAGRMVGVYLHDVIGVHDHLAARLGQVARYLPVGAVRTCEFQSHNSAQEVAAGVRWLAEKWCVSKA